VGKISRDDIKSKPQGSAILSLKLPASTARSPSASILRQDARNSKRWHHSLHDGFPVDRWKGAARRSRNQTELHEPKSLPVDVDSVRSFEENTNQDREVIDGEAWLKSR
jgi:hypothetical protein